MRNKCMKIEIGNGRPSWTTRRKQSLLFFFFHFFLNCGCLLLLRSRNKICQYANCTHTHHTRQWNKESYLASQFGQKHNQIMTLYGFCIVLFFLILIFHILQMPTSIRYYFCFQLHTIVKTNDRRLSESVAVSLAAQ